MRTFAIQLFHSVSTLFFFSHLFLSYPGLSVSDPSSVLIGIFIYSMNNFLDYSFLSSFWIYPPVFYIFPHIFEKYNVLRLDYLIAFNSLLEANAFSSTYFRLSTA